MRIRHLSIAAAVSLVAPLMTVMPPGMFDASADPAPVETSETQVELQDPASTAGDGDVVTGKDLTLAKTQAAESELSAKARTEPVVLELSPEQPVPADLVVMGVTWQAGTATDLVVQYRARTASGWGPWQGVDSEADGGDTGAEAASARAGSDPIVVTGASHVQVRALGAAGQEPVDAKLTLIDPKTVAADANVGSVAPGSAQAAAAKPWINSRAAWGANESIRGGAPSYARVQGAVVHHTAGTNNYTQAQVPAILRGIYAFHVKDRGWSDVGYNFLVDKWGRVWEGRYGGVDRAVVGAHATGVNSQTMGISVMGDYSKTAVSSAAVNAIKNVIAWKADLHGFNPSGHITLLGKRVPTISGHRDVGSTTCPGTSLYAQLGAIRRDVVVRTGGRGSSSPSAGARPAPVAAAGTSRGVPADNVLVRGAANALFASAPRGNDLTFARRVDSSSWAGYNAVVAAGDLNRDGIGDVVARTSGAASNLMLFRGKADGTLNKPVRIGTGWRSLRSITGGADLNRDGVPDLLAIDNKGRLLIYKGNGKGGFHSAAVVGTGWGNFAHVISVGNWDGTGHGDIVGVRRDGKGFLYVGDGTGKFRSGSIALSGRFSTLRTLTGLVGRKALAGVDASGNGYVVSYKGRGAITTAKATPTFRGVTVFGG